MVGAAEWGSGSGSSGGGVSGGEWVVAGSESGGSFFFCFLLSHV